jgi:PPOX class probable F420-dependent enzyme
MPPARLDDLGGRFVRLTTYRRDGTPVPTPMWFVADGDGVWLWTRLESGKVRRLRNNADVTVAPCDSKGEVTGSARSGTAKLAGPTEPSAERLFDEKYGLPLKLWRRAHALIRRLGRGHEWVYVRVELTEAFGAS